jgi:hypothetical protein
MQPQIAAMVGLRSLGRHVYQADGWPLLGVVTLKQLKVAVPRFGIGR